MEITRIQSFLFALCFLFFWGCTAVETRPPAVNSDAYSAISFTRVELKGEDNSVSMKDIEAYLHFKTLAYDKKAVSVEPLADGEDTLLYVINYEEGWEIIAGDKRAPVRLAYGESGAFSFETENVEMLAWIESLAADVQALKHMEDFSSCTEKQLSNMQSSRKFWALVCCEIEAPCPMTRYDPINDSLITPFILEGHWELYASSTTEETYDDFRLMQTHWGQETNHFNEYCPLRTDKPTIKAYAGCVAVAGAQMLYYLHSNISVPENAPDTVYCSGNIGDYIQLPGGSSSTTWNYMLSNSENEKGYYSAAVLIADVGKKVNMQYGNLVSLAATSDLPNSVFSQYGIDCTYETYDADSIYYSLVNELPAIVRAYGNSNLYFGHAFIIDGCRSYRIHSTYYYEWVWENGHGGVPVPCLPERVEHVYSLPIITDFRMNWGWADSHDNYYYAKSGNWEIQNSDGSISNYIYDRKMICGFSPLN